MRLINNFTLNLTFLLVLPVYLSAQNAGRKYPICLSLIVEAWDEKTNEKCIGCHVKVTRSDSVSIKAEMDSSGVVKFPYQKYHWFLIPEETYEIEVFANQSCFVFRKSSHVYRTSKSILSTKGRNSSTDYYKMFKGEKINCDYFAPAVAFCNDTSANEFANTEVLDEEIAKMKVNKKKVFLVHYQRAIEKNEAIANIRLEKVKEYLISKGIEPERITTGKSYTHCYAYGWILEKVIFRYYD